MYFKGDNGRRNMIDIGGIKTEIGRLKSALKKVLLQF